MASLYNDQGELNLFGYTVSKKDKDANIKSFVPAGNDSGGAEYSTYSGAAYNSYTIDLDPSGIKTESDLIQKYREMSLVADIDLAIGEIVDEFLVLEEKDKAISLDFDENFATKYSQNTKNLILDEFENIVNLLNFNQNGHDIFRNFYVDGRLAYHKLVDSENTKLGITELRPIDVAKLKRVVEIKKERDTNTNATIIKGQSEYFVFSENGFIGDYRTGLKISSDSITYVTSGLLDRNSNVAISYLHKAIRPLNQLRMMEDSDVIYRMTRAPERRVFYIDTSGMARTKAEQYIKDVMARYKNKQVYDSLTGTLKDDKKHLSILEDFWLPRSSGGKGTEITTLPGSGTLGALENTEYFQTKLWQALGLPTSRMQNGQGTFNIGRGNEITRDEIKFAKFIAKLRRRFNLLFIDLLKTQLLLKGITTPEDWETIKDSFIFRYGKDNFFAELKESDIFKERMSNAVTADSFVGKYFSQRYVMREILKMTDQQCNDMLEQIQDEAKTAAVNTPINPEDDQTQPDEEQPPDQQPTDEPEDGVDDHQPDETPK